MRRLFALAAAALTAAALALPASAENVFRRANGNEPATLDPQKYELVSENNVLRDLFEGLTTQDADNRIVPGQAESWTHSEDGLVWTFKLREGLLWSDGAPVTADDFVLGARRVVDPKTAAKIPDPAFKILNARAILKGEMAPETLGVRAVDPRTVEVTLAEPSPLVPNIMSMSMMAPTPSHVFAQHGEDWSKAGIMVSNGPFQLAEWTPQSRVRIVKNPNYRDAASVALDAVEFYPTDDAEAALKRFRAGELDFLPALPPASAQFAMDELPDAFRSTPVNQVRYLELNHRRDKLKDLRVRRALAMTIDRQAIAGPVMRDLAVPAYGFVPRSIEGYQGSAFDFADAPMADKIETARRLLAEAGYVEGSPLEIQLRCLGDSWARPVCAAVAEMWARAGVAVSVETSEAKAHYGAVDVGDFDVAISGWFGTDDPEDYFWLFQTGGGINECGYSSAALDETTRRAERTLDQGARYATFAEAEKLMLDDVATIPLFWTIQSALVSPRIEGFDINPRGATRSRFAKVATPN